MVNRFFSPSQQFADSAGAPLAGGFLYFYASGTSTPLTTYSNATLATPNLNPVPLDSAGRAGNIFLQDLAYKVTLTDSLLNQIWTADPVYSSDFSTIAQFQTTAGSPNGQLAGTAGSSGVPADADWDRTNNILYVCTTTGSSSTAVWTAVNATTAAAVVPTPQGYLTPVSGTPIITTDSVAATVVYYTPYIGNLVPIYNGATFVPTVFTELTMTLSASQAANGIYDLFVFSASGVPTLAVGPAWTTATAGAGARGTGAGTTQLTRISGFLVNAVSMTARNGATTYSVAANQATYVGSLSMDSSAGQVTCHRGYGQTRRWSVWNAYNRTPVYLKAGDPTASWTYGTNTTRQSNAAAGNTLCLFNGLIEEFANITFNQDAQIALPTATPQSGGVQIGIGINSTTVMTGEIGYVNLGSNVGAAGALQVSDRNSMAARYSYMPTLGINNINSLEIAQSANSTNTIYGTETDMILQAVWRA